MLAILFKTQNVSAVPSGLLEKLNPNPKTRVNDEIHQTPEQPAATDALEEAVESLLETNAANNIEDGDHLRASNAVRSKRNAVISSTEANRDSYVSVCSPCHGDSEYIYVSLQMWNKNK